MAATWLPEASSIPIDPVPTLLGHWQTISPTLVAQLRRYAIDQSASSLLDIDTLTAHELVHLEQAQQQAWSLPNGQSIPQPQHWPTSTQLQYLPRDIASHTPYIYDNYIKRHPTNTPGDLLNEIHAYTVTLPHLCRVDKQASQAHHIPQLQQFLLTLNSLTGNRTDLPPANQQAITTLTRYAAKTLAYCKQ